MGHHYLKFKLSVRQGSYRFNVTVGPLDQMRIVKREMKRELSKARINAVYDTIVDCPHEIAQLIGEYVPEPEYVLVYPDGSIKPLDHPGEDYSSLLFHEIDHRSVPGYYIVANYEFDDGQDVLITVNVTHGTLQDGTMRDVLYKATILAYSKEHDGFKVHFTVNGHTREISWVAPHLLRCTRSPPAPRDVEAGHGPTDL